MIQHLQWRNYEWNRDYVPMCKENYRFVNKLVYRRCADVTAMMLCSRFLYGLTDSLLNMKEFSSENWIKPYACVRTAVANMVIMMQLHKHSNNVLIVMFQLKEDYPENTSVRLIAKNGKEIDVNGSLIDPMPITEENPLIPIEIVSALAISSISHHGESRNVAIKRAFHMLVFFQHSRMIGTCEKMPVLHIRTNSPKKTYDSYSFDEIHISDVDDAGELFNKPFNVPYTRALAVAVRRADAIFPVIAEKD